MSGSYIIFIALLLLVIIPEMTRKKKIPAVRYILNRKKQNKEKSAMKELAKQFIGKECIVYTVMSADSGIRGTIKEVNDGGIIIEKGDGIEAVNLDYVTRIREWPRNAKGKKKVIFG